MHSKREPLMSWSQAEKGLRSSRNAYTRLTAITGTDHSGGIQKAPAFSCIRAGQFTATAAFVVAQWALLGVECAFALRGWLWTAGSLAITVPLFLQPVLEINGF